MNPDEFNPDQLERLADAVEKIDPVTLLSRAELDRYLDHTSTPEDLESLEQLREENPRTYAELENLRTLADQSIRELREELGSGPGLLSRFASIVREALTAFNELAIPLGLEPAAAGNTAEREPNHVKSGEVQLTSKEAPDGSLIIGARVNDRDAEGLRIEVLAEHQGEAETVGELTLRAPSPAAEFVESVLALSADSRHKWADARIGLRLAE